MADSGEDLGPGGGGGTGGLVMEGPQVGVVSVKVSGRAQWAWVGAVSTAGSQRTASETARPAPSPAPNHQGSECRSKEARARQGPEKRIFCGHRDEVGPAKSSVRREGNIRTFSQEKPTGNEGEQTEKGKEPSESGG